MVIDLAILAKGVSSSMLQTPMSQTPSNRILKRNRRVSSKYCSSGSDTLKQKFPKWGDAFGMRVGRVAKRSLERA